MLESASGRAVLGLNLLPDGRQELSFLTTRPFAAEQLSPSAGASALTSFPVYNAFADDRTGGVPSIVAPLPVELTAFSGRWANGAAELNWATASEKNSSHFVVERSTAVRPLSGQWARWLPRAPAPAHVPTSCATRQPAPRAWPCSTTGCGKWMWTAKKPFRRWFRWWSANSPQRRAWKVYPNPASAARAVLVHCPNLPASGGLLQTYSQLGQLVSQVPVTEGTAGLALPALAPGLYHVVLRDAAGQTLATQRLVVEGH